MQSACQLVFTAKQELFRVVDKLLENGHEYACVHIDNVAGLLKTALPMPNQPRDRTTRCDGAAKIKKKSERNCYAAGGGAAS